MAVRQITKLLGTIPVRRVEGGDGWIDRANAELGENIFHRSMSGDEIANKYSVLNADQKMIADTAFEINETEMTELVDEVYRIREDVTENVKDDKKDSALQTFGFILSMFLTSAGLIAATFVILATVRNHDIPPGYVFQVGKALFTYLANGTLSESE